MKKTTIRWRKSYDRVWGGEPERKTLAWSTVNPMVQWEQAQSVSSVVSAAGSNWSSVDTLSIVLSSWIEWAFPGFISRL